MQPMRAVTLTAMAVALTIATSAANGAVFPTTSFVGAIEDTFATSDLSTPSTGAPGKPSPTPATVFTPAATRPTVTSSLGATTSAGSSVTNTQESTTSVPTVGSTAASTNTGSTASTGTESGGGVPMFNSDNAAVATLTQPVVLPAATAAVTTPTGNGISTSTGNGVTPPTGNGVSQGVVNKQEQANTVSSPVLLPTAAGSQSSFPTEQAGFAPIPTAAAATRNSAGNGPSKLQTTATPTPKSAKPTKTPTPTSDSDSSRSDGSDGLTGDSSASLASEMSYACVCNDVRKVSLMSAADYCLLPSAVIGDKCGNAAVGEKGECPKAGAQPCQDTGHVLTNDSVCAYDKRDETYKCVASKEDLYIQKHGKAKKKSNASNSSSSSPAASSEATSIGSARTATQFVLLVASLVVGLVAVA